MKITSFVTPKHLVTFIAAFLSILFITIVLIERIPGVLTFTSVPYEWLMFGTYKISLVDDITHAMSGLFGVLALISGYRWTVRYLLVIGGYYALDALFYVVNGIITGQDFISNILLNGPHIGITILVAIALTSSIRKIELA